MTKDDKAVPDDGSGQGGSHAAPWRQILPILAAGVLVGLEVSHVLDDGSLLFFFLAAPVLVFTVFSAVHFAEVVSLRIGQPFGSILLAAAVTVIEVALVVSMLLNPSHGDTTIARDTVFATLMVVLNGVVGLSLLIGGIRHREQLFHSQGAVAAFSVLGALAILTLILPNFTVAVEGPFYSPAQLVFVSIVSLALYAVFIFAQTVRHKSDYVDVAALGEDHPIPTGRETAFSLLFLALSLVAVILLAEALAPTVERGVAAAGLADAFVGVIIAAVVLLPEGLTALKAAAQNRLQTSLNVSTGSALASIGLSIPTIAAVSMAMGKDLTLGLHTEHSVLLALTLFVGTLTLATGRTTIVQGAVHLVIFGCFLMIAAVP
uniref:calcium:proton antiporter n=1 Tax=Stappia sp. TaxID=1870903 RepID=UPI003BAD69D7